MLFQTDISINKFPFKADQTYLAMKTIVSCLFFFKSSFLPIIFSFFLLDKITMIIGWVCWCFGRGWRRSRNQGWTETKRCSLQQMISYQSNIFFFTNNFPITPPTFFVLFLVLSLLFLRGKFLICLSALVLLKDMHHGVILLKPTVVAHLLVLRVWFQISLYKNVLYIRILCIATKTAFSLHTFFFFFFLKRNYWRKCSWQHWLCRELFF